MRLHLIEQSLMNVSKKSFCSDLSIQVLIKVFFKQGFIKICRVKKCHCPTFTQPSITLIVLEEECKDIQKQITVMYL